MVPWPSTLYSKKNKNHMTLLLPLGYKASISILFRLHAHWYFYLKYLFHQEYFYFILFPMQSKLVPFSSLLVRFFWGPGGGGQDGILIH